MDAESKEKSEPTQICAESAEAGNAGPSPPGKKIVVFADGTGNAFTKQESNVWRLYQSLDRSNPDQIARYIQGVGTSGNRLIANIDGATGFGVPSNVRKLYRFICWNWEPGDEIFMFGFSRGSFTIRTLASLIHDQGLMPKEICGKPVSRAEMRANSLGAWRRYRENTVRSGLRSFLAAKKEKNTKSALWRIFTDAREVSPTVGMIRLVRDSIVWTYRKFRNHRSHDMVLKLLETRQKERSAGEVPIRFLGLFDTVEAYGVPIEELRKPINYWIWPISFRNRFCSEAVQTVRHALSIDDERKTFHPVRFDQSPRDGAKTEIGEVWFAGMHSDVGGGYPDDSLAYTPFCWMAREACAMGLDFQRDNLNFFFERTSAFAHINNSRKGLKALYRYSPRRITSTAADGREPVVHHSVIQKIVAGTEGYAPITLPDAFRVQMIDGSIGDVERFDNSEPAEVPDKKQQPPEPEALKQAALEQEALAQQAPEREPDAAALRGLRDQKPNLKRAHIVRNLIVLRRLAYFALILGVIYLALFPLLGGALKYIGLGFDENGIQIFAKAIVDWVANFTPGIMQPWLDAFRDYPIPALLAIFVVAALYVFNLQLSDRINDAALNAWDSRRKQAPLPPNVRLSLWLVKALRLKEFWKVLERGHIRVIPGVLFILILIVAVAVAVNWTFVMVLVASGGLCTDEESDWVELSPDVPSHSEAGFTPSSPCWPTGVELEEGRTYTLWIDQRTKDNMPFVDRTIPVGAAAFKSSAWRHRLMAPTFRRWIGADWFQPIAQIGKYGDESFPLAVADGQPPLLVPRKGLKFDDGAGIDISESWECLPDIRKDEFEEKLLQLETDPKAFGGDVGIPLVFVARFKAPATGKLYLYVNDVLILWDRRAFYRNNAGSATVTIEMEQNPDVPGVQGPGN